MGWFFVITALGFGRWPVSDAKVKRGTEVIFQLFKERGKE